MKSWWLIIGVIGMGAVIAAYCFLQSRLGDPFAKYVSWPVPRSICNVRCESNEKVYLLTPEPVVWVGFSGSATDLDALVEKGFQRASAERREFMEQSAPIWWRRPIAAEAQVYTRESWRGAEYLQIDETGTNGLYWLWGI